MTGWRKRQVVDMAREAIQEAPREDWNSTAWVFGDETLERFAELVRADEREACAKVCEDSVEYAGDTLAQAIRAGSNT